MSASIPVIIGTILAIGATVVLCILVMPEKKKDKLNKFFSVIRDIFNFKTLYIEKILKVLYIFTTFACILIGFFLLFSVERYGGFFGSYSRWNGWTGLILMFIGPVIARIIYEYSLLLVITASKLMSIDKKIPNECCKKGPDDTKAVEPAPAPAPAPEPDPTPAWKPAAGVTPPWVHNSETAAPAAEPAPAPAPIPEPEPVYRYCAYCGTKYDTNKGGCPNCGR
ncbi:MAG: hypothetical protein E7233_00695 [Lachnospiraceae bacterium]|nr:hypothetical protein [Lachnospiraceae bacterium]